jgi:hypothetical protein
MGHSSVGTRHQGNNNGPNAVFLELRGQRGQEGMNAFFKGFRVPRTEFIYRIGHLLSSKGIGSTLMNLFYILVLVVG